MKKAMGWLRYVKQWLRGLLPVLTKIKQTLAAIQTAMPFVMKKFPQLALWAAAIYAVIDILLKLIG